VVGLVQSLGGEMLAGEGDVKKDERCHLVSPFDYSDPGWDDDANVFSPYVPDKEVIPV